MDMKEASAMTEASGLVNEQGGNEHRPRRASDPSGCLRRMPRPAGPGGCAR